METGVQEVVPQNKPYVVSAEKSTYALLMAGGVGSRFWPLSRPERPKQFLKFFGDASLMQMTSSRLDGLIPPENRYVVTNARYVDDVVRQMPEIPRPNILDEPVSRNTAPCIAYSALRLAELDPEGVMVVLPADHLIQDVPTFHDVVKVAIEAARTKGILVTIGIRPTFPATGFGYVEYDPESVDGAESIQAFVVSSFSEKPDEQTARQFLDSGRYLWNSGMFVWRVDTILDEMRRSAPEIMAAFDGIRGDGWSDLAAVTKAFVNSPRVSIDYSVMERASEVRVVPGEFGWNDVGDWDAAYQLSKKDNAGNATRGHVDTVDATNCFAYAAGRRIVLLATDNLVVVDAGDTILVCDRNQTQRVKEAAALAFDSGKDQ